MFFRLHLQQCNAHLLLFVGWLCSIVHFCVHRQNQMILILLGLLVDFTQVRTSSIVKNIACSTFYLYS